MGDLLWHPHGILWNLYCVVKRSFSFTYDYVLFLLLYILFHPVTYTILPKKFSPKEIQVNGERVLSRT
jgi:hypothetical protein